MELVLAADSPRLSSSGGCNRLMGRFSLESEQLRFSQLASTKRACSSGAMAFEQQVIGALAQVRRWSLAHRTLRLQDERGRWLLMFQVAP